MLIDVIKMASHDHWQFKKFYVDKCWQSVVWQVSICVSRVYSQLTLSIVITQCIFNRVAYGSQRLNAHSVKQLICFTNCFFAQRIKRIQVDDTLPLKDKLWDHNLAQEEEWVVHCCLYVWSHITSLLYTELHDAPYALVYQKQIIHLIGYIKLDNCFYQWCPLKDYWYAL